MLHRNAEAPKNTDQVIEHRQETAIRQRERPDRAAFPGHSRDVHFTPDSVEKVLFGAARNFLEPLMRFARGDVFRCCSFFDFCNSIPRRTDVVSPAGYVG
jgi:hypothetical protein